MLSQHAGQGEVTKDIIKNETELVIGQVWNLCNRAYESDVVLEERFFFSLFKSEWREQCKSYKDAKYSWKRQSAQSNIGTN